MSRITIFCATTTSEPCLIMLEIPKSKHYKKREKKWKSTKKKNKNYMLVFKEEIAIIKESYGSLNNVRFSYDNLGNHPNLKFLEEHKVPKFEMFNGIKNSVTYLGSYYDRIIKIVKTKASLMRHFSYSLSDTNLEWLTLQELKKWPCSISLVKDFIEWFAYNVEISQD